MLNVLVFYNNHKEGSKGFSPTTNIYIYHFSKHILGKKKICANSLLYSGKLKSTNIKSWALAFSSPHFTVNLLKWYWSCFWLASTSPIPVKSQAGERSQKVALMQLA